MQLAVTEALDDEEPLLSSTEALLSMPLTVAKRLTAFQFERRYLIHVMARANGHVAEGARLAGVDRTNFRRLLQRHNLR
jgi:two-component system response regulator HydG